MESRQKMIHFSPQTIFLNCKLMKINLNENLQPINFLKFSCPIFIYYVCLGILCKI